MATAYAFLIKDADEDYQAGILIQSERSLDFNEIKRLVEDVVRHDDMCDRCWMRMADEETTYDITEVNGVPMARFTFHNVMRRDWAMDAAQVMAKTADGYAVILFSEEALAITVKNTVGLMGLDDMLGPLRGIPHKEM